jgi:rhodanese-related sulfurtransferase
MNKKSWFSLVAIALCSVGAHAATDHFKLIHVNDLVQLQQTPTAKVAIFDANTDETRKTDGMIPGAKPLTASNSYSQSVLPTDKTTQLVFYCANTACMASHAAAARATKWGYTNVAVMADGIQGWKKSGQPTVKP